MNSTETAAVLAVFHAAYAMTIPDETALLWANVFSDADGQAVMNAARYWVLEETNPPTPADIRDVMRVQRSDEARRQQMDQDYTSRDDPDDRQVPAPEGLLIAYEAYCTEVEAQGRTPKEWDDFKKAIPEELVHARRQ